MHPLLKRHGARIAEICRRRQVARLELFGSAARGADFDVERSDVDLLVEFDKSTGVPSLAEFFALRDELAALLERPVDLVMAGAVRNPFVRADMKRSRAPLYAA